MSPILLLSLSDELPDTNISVSLVGDDTIAACTAKRGLRHNGGTRTYKSSSSFESAVIDLSSLTGTGPFVVADLSPPDMEAMIPPNVATIVPRALYTPRQHDP